MTNKTTKHKPKITLEHGKTYVTAGGERITVYSKRDSDDFYKFEGSNGYNYGVNGKGFENSNADYAGFNIVSKYEEPQTTLHCTVEFYDKLIAKFNHEKEPQVQPKLYTAKELLSAMSDSYNNGKAYGRIFSTSELQSLTKMQSKVITALEAEILELKETAQCLGNYVGLFNRVNGLRKQIFNEITSKKKRLVKMVELQSRMKRSK
jgi:hypothetical protein